MYTFIWRDNGGVNLQLIETPVLSMGICHGDHWHVIYLASAGNSARKLQSIVRVLMSGERNQSNLEGVIVTCAMTKQLIRSPLNFLRYLVRKYNGKYFVDITNNQIKYLWEMFTDLLKDRRQLEQSNEDFDCQNPTSLKRMRMREEEEWRKRSRFDREKSLFDIFQSLNIQSEEQFLQWVKYNPEQLPELWSRYPNWEKKLQQYVNVMVKTKCGIFDEPFYTKSYLECVANAQCPDALHDTNTDAGAKYMYDIFVANGIDFAQFIEQVDNIIRMKYPRKNALVLRGPTSTGKTLIAKNIVKPYNFGTVSRDGDATAFYLQNLLDHDVALMEEPHISMTTVQNFKELFAGSPLIVQVKNHAPRELKRIPCIVTTNQSLTDSLVDAESEPIKRRIVEYLLYRPIDTDYSPIICFHTWQTLCTRFFNNSLFQ